MKPDLIERLLTRYASSPKHPAKWHILNLMLKATRKTTLVAPTQFGIMKLDTNDYVQAKIFHNGCYEPNTLKLVRALLRPGDCFVDVGANVGQFSLAAAALVGDTGRVLAFEPNPEICTDLMWNRRASAFGARVEVAAMALSDQTHLCEFEQPPALNRGMSRERRERSAEWYRVHATTLAEFCKHAGINRVRLAKIDVEGDEFRVVRGALAGGLHLENIIFEFEPSHYDSHAAAREILCFLKDKGYEITDVLGNADPQSFDECNVWAKLKEAR